MGGTVFDRLFESYDPSNSEYSESEINSIMAIYILDLPVSVEIRLELEAYKILNGHEGDLSGEYSFLL